MASFEDLRNSLCCKFFFSNCYHWYMKFQWIFWYFLGVVESILCAQTYADKHKYRVSANRELVAVGKWFYVARWLKGLVNFIGSFFQIFPAFGSLARTSINDSAGNFGIVTSVMRKGAKSQTGALFSIIVVLSAILFFLPYFANLPKVVMGAIIGTMISDRLYSSSKCCNWASGNSRRDFFVETSVFIYPLSPNLFSLVPK